MTGYLLLTKDEASLARSGPFAITRAGEKSHALACAPRHYLRRHCLSCLLGRRGFCREQLTGTRCRREVSCRLELFAGNTKVSILQIPSPKGRLCCYSPSLSPQVPGDPICAHSAHLRKRKWRGQYAQLAGQLSPASSMPLWTPFRLCVALDGAGSGSRV